MTLLSTAPFTITVITPSYNRAGFLAETIESVLGQHDPNLEYIVIDDGSTDGSAAVVEPYLDRLRYLRHDNIGETATVNKALAMATGEWIAVVNSDDPVMPGWLALMRKAIADNPGKALIYPDWVRVDERGNALAIIRQPNYCLHNMLPHPADMHLNCTIGPGVLIRRSLYQQLKGRQPHIKYAADMDLVYRAALKTPFVHVPVVLATHREHGDAASSAARGRRMAREVARVAQDVVNDPSYPADLKKYRAFTLSHIWLCTIAFSGRSKRAKLEHLLLALYYCSLYAVQHKIKYFLLWPADFFIKTLTKVFRLPIALCRVVLRKRGIQQSTYVLTIAVLRLLFVKKIPVASLRTAKEFVLIGNGFPPHWSGQAVVLGRILSRFDSACYAILAAQDEGLSGARLPCDHAFLPTLAPGMNAFQKSRALLKQFRQMVDFIACHRPAAVIVCSGDLMLPFLAFWAAQLTRKKFFFYQFDDYVHQWWATPRLEQFARRFERIIHTKTQGVIVPCDALAAALKYRFPISNIIVVPNPAESITMPSSVPPSGAGKKLVFAGSLYHLNQALFLQLVKAVDAITTCEVSIELYSGLDKDHLAALGIASPKVHIHPYVAPDKIHAALAESDLQVICLSHVPTSLPLVNTSATAKLADYLATGKPILALAPAESFIARYINNNQCGVVCSSDDAAEIQSALIGFFSDAAAAARMARQAVECAKRDFSPEASTNRLKLFLHIVPKTGQSVSEKALVAQTPRKQMKIVQISAADQPGAQANGFLLHRYFRTRGLDSAMVVQQKNSADPDVTELGLGWRNVANTLIAQAEERFSYYNTRSIMAPRLKRLPLMKQADIIHLQLLHALPFLRWKALPELFAGKKIVWTIHDMYMLTGHCVYSLSCSRWQAGCGECPDLGLPFPMHKDNTARMFGIKRDIFARLRPHMVVGSGWMKEVVQKSPILNDLPCHLIPFGTPLDIFHPQPRGSARRYFGIPEDAHVICFRSAPFGRNFKGTDFIRQALELYMPTRPTYVLTFQWVGDLPTLRSKYRFVELGWTENQQLMALAYNAADVFLMPSIAEAFGLMAIESLACGTPVIVFSGTALSETANAPLASIEVPMGNAAALSQAIDKVLNTPGVRENMSAAGLAHVRQKHDFTDHAERHLDLYENILAGAA